MEASPSTSSSIKQAQLEEFEAFPRNSVNLIVGPTHIGKTHFVKELLSNYKIYFQKPVYRILIVLCNERVQPIEFDQNLLDEEEIVIEQISISEFIPNELQEHDLVVLDDVQTVTEPIRLTISVCAHHYNLVALFIITHNLLGNANFELVNYCHRLFLFMSASSNARLILYIINHFYHDVEIKKYLKSVFSFCQREKEVLALELNPLANKKKHSQVILAFSHLTRFINKNYFFLYPDPHWGQEYIKKFSHQLASSSKMNDALDAPNESDYPLPTLVAVPLGVLVEKKKNDGGGGGGGKNKESTAKCSEQAQWEETIAEIEENIESYFPPPRWQKIKNLAKEILRHSDFCVKTNGKTFHLKDRPRTEVSMIDFLAVATRRAGPMERERDPTWKLYSIHVETLLKNNAPKDLFKNKLLVPKKYQ